MMSEAFFAFTSGGPSVDPLAGDGEPIRARFAELSDSVPACEAGAERSPAVSDRTGDGEDTTVH